MNSNSNGSLQWSVIVALAQMSLRERLAMTFVGTFLLILVSITGCMTAPLHQPQLITFDFLAYRSGESVWPTTYGTDLDADEMFAEVKEFRVSNASAMSIVVKEIRLSNAARTFVLAAHSSGVTSSSNYVRCWYSGLPFVVEAYTTNVFAVRTPKFYDPWLSELIYDVLPKTNAVPQLVVSSGWVTNTPSKFSRGVIPPERQIEAPVKLSPLLLEDLKAITGRP